MSRFVSFCAFFILIISSTGAVALSQPHTAAARETAPHTTNPSPSVAVHGTFSQPTTAYLSNKDGSGGDVGITTDPINAFPVMQIAAMLMTCAAASIMARDRIEN